MWYKSVSVPSGAKAVRYHGCGMAPTGWNRSPQQAQPYFSPYGIEINPEASLWVSVLQPTSMLHMERAGATRLQRGLLMHLSSPGHAKNVFLCIELLLVLIGR